MRLIVSALILALALGTVQAIPLQGGDENVNAVLFGAVRTSLGDQNATQEILKLDIGLIGAENVSYELVDQNNDVYQPKQVSTPIQPGRYNLFFQIPKDDLFKFIKITPTAGMPFNIKWWATPSGTNGDAIVRYYGIVDWLATPDEQALVVQLKAVNNGTQHLYLSPENFTLLDQWGWPYVPTLGFDPQVIGPKDNTSRLLLGFQGLSPLSRPRALAYDYTAPNQILIDLENDLVPLSDEKAYGTNATGNATAAPVQAAPSQAPAAAAAAAAPALAESQAAAANQTQPSETNAAKVGSLKDEINATKERLGVAGSDGSTAVGSSAVGDKTRAGVEDAKKRLERMKQGLSADTNDI